MNSLTVDFFRGDLLQHYQNLVRDMYAFYPLLIKYVDLHRSNWLKNSMIETEMLYLCVAEVFNLWVKSHVSNPSSLVSLTYRRVKQGIDVPLLHPMTRHDYLIIDVNTLVLCISNISCSNTLCLCSHNGHV